jgi:hypothetical protein
VDGTNLLVESAGEDLLAACEAAVASADCLLAVSYPRTAGEFLEAAREVTGGLPPDVAVLDARWSGSPTARGATVRSAAPDDIGEIGATFSELLADRGDGTVLVVFDSVTALLQYADLETVYRFLHVFTSQVREADATGVYGLLASHEETTVTTLEHLFDDTVGSVPR